MDHLTRESYPKINLYTFIPMALNGEKKSQKPTLRYESRCSYVAESFFSLTVNFRKKKEETVLSSLTGTGIYSRHYGRSSLPRWHHQELTSKMNISFFLPNCPLLTKEFWFEPIQIFNRDVICYFFFLFWPHLCQLIFFILYIFYIFILHYKI